MPAASPPTLEGLSIHWQWALDTAAGALAANRFLLPAGELHAEQQTLARERRETMMLLGRIAALHGSHAKPWLAPGPVGPRMLGLPAATRAVIFDLDGVLTNSAALHATAWAETLDPFLLEIAHDTGWPFVPFDRDLDYTAYFDGRPRLEGLRLFLAGRGLGVANAAVQALAEAKGRMLEHGLRVRGVAALPGARDYLHAAGLAQLPRAVVSASTTTLPMLELAELTELVEARVDAEDIRDRGLRSRPAPDLLLAACGALGIRPQDAVSLTHSGAGIVAARSAAMPTIGVAAGARADSLRDYGAPAIVPSLDALLDPRLRAS